MKKIIGTHLIVKTFIIHLKEVKREKIVGHVSTMRIRSLVNTDPNLTTFHILTNVK